MSVDHAWLVDKAAIRLRRDHPIVITEMASWGEEADAIGFHGRHTTLIECKTSRADFLSDKKKSFRRMPETGLGMYRYYMTLPGLLAETEFPPSWGLLEIHKRGVRRIRVALPQESNSRAEIALLMSVIRRLGPMNPPGVSVKFYTYETQNRATVGVDFMKQAGRG